MDFICRVAIVDDHKIFRAGLELILNGLSSVKVIGQAANASQLMGLLKKSPVDLIFMDIKMPDIDGIELTKTVLEKYPKVSIVALSMFGEIEYFNKMMDAGASGFLLKHTQEDELETAIQVVMEGNQYFSKEFMNNVSQQVVVQGKKTDIKLSGREQEVLELICKGFSNHEIADELHISAHTVDGHRRNLIGKTGVKNAASLVMFAVKNGLVEA